MTCQENKAEGKGLHIDAKDKVCGSGMSINSNALANCNNWIDTCSAIIRTLELNGGKKIQDEGRIGK